VQCEAVLQSHVSAMASRSADNRCPSRLLDFLLPVPSGLKHFSRRDRKIGGVEGALTSLNLVREPCRDGLEGVGQCWRQGISYQEVIAIGSVVSEYLLT
jgi:hypothetical protein